MNPNTTIRTWLLTVGEAIGIRQAFDYRWIDADVRRQVEYFTYKLIRMQPNEVGVRDLSTASTYDAVQRGVKSYLNTFQIDLYRDQDGMYDLAACEVAADHNRVIRRNFKAHGVSFDQVQSIENLTPDDLDEKDLKEFYHMRMICTFNENVEYTITETNGIVEQIDLTLNTEYPTYEINRSGITIT